MAQPLTVGNIAPDFTLFDQDGHAVKLSGFRGQPVVLFFYPKDDSPGCTAQACSFRDQHQVFAEAGAIVIGISHDTSASHRRFADKHRLPYRLLADTDGTVQQTYGVTKTLGLLPGRVTFVIDGDGVVRHRFASQLLVYQHIDEALTVVKGLAQGQLFTNSA